MWGTVGITLRRPAGPHSGLKSRHLFQKPLVFLSIRVAWNTGIFPASALIYMQLTDVREMVGVC